MQSWIRQLLVVDPHALVAVQIGSSGSILKLVELLNEIDGSRDKAFRITYIWWACMSLPRFEGCDEMHVPFRV